MRSRLLVLASPALALALLAAPPIAEADGTGTIRITPTIDPPGEVQDQAVPHGSRFKIRDGNGDVVAEGGISGSGGNRSNYQTEGVDLPPGEYTVEIYYHSEGAPHSGGTRDYKGEKKVEVKEGETGLHQIDVEPRNPEEHLQDQIQHQEDNLDDAEDAVKDLEDDIARHRRNGEPVGEEHTDMLDDLNDDVDAIKDRLRRMRRQLRDMRAARLQTDTNVMEGVRKGVRVPVHTQKKGGTGKY